MKRWILPSLLAIGCGSDDALLERTETEVSVHAERTAPLTWEEFREGAQKDDRGGFIVDADIPISSETQLRNYYLSWFSNPNALSVNRVMGADDIWAAPNRFQLSYCINASSFGTRFAAVEAALQRAAASWSSVAGVGFLYRPDQNASCNASNTNVIFDVRYTNSPLGPFALSFFPGDARSIRNLLVDEKAFTTSAGGRDLEGILRHELGHSLGFRHEHIWLTPTCAGTLESSSDARQVTAYDVDSVMHYPQCRPSGTGGYRQTARDNHGAITLYGMSAALIAGMSI